MNIFEKMCILLSMANKEKTQIEEQFHKERMEETVRLNKYLSEAGICSRREADRMIEAGRVMVDGEAAQMGMRVSRAQKVFVDGSEVSPEEEMILLAVNKPVGVVCTTDERWGDVTVENMLNYPKRIFSIGRLDKNSQGLLLMTNNGDILNKIMRAGNYHEKEYEVTIDCPVTPDFLKRMAAGGIPVQEQLTRPCKVKQLGSHEFSIILTQGLNRQIRRMCQYLGCQVIKLKRVRIMNIRLGRLKEGAYRELTRQELSELDDMLKNSSSAPVMRETVEE